MSTLQVRVSDGVIRLVLDHPPVNVLTREVLHELRGALEAFSDHADSDARAVLLSAAGRHFSAGADVGEHLPPTFEQLIPEFLDTVAALDRCPLPVVAAVRGRCLGGGFELALAADIVIASDTASFGQPEVALGVAPPAAAVWLPTRCPRAIAAELLFTGDTMSAAEAERAGLVRRVVPDVELETCTDALLARLTRHSAAALREIKQMMRAGDPDSDGLALASAGHRYVHSLMNTADAVEGLRAFVGKRAAVWRHR
jgi:cyclohexa-1,5-dienecarbonyl-CoA hydratase